MKVTLTILKDDILNNDYLDSDNCPITKALARAGYPYLKDYGTDIEDEADNIVCSKDNCEGYKEMVQTLMKMYDSKWNGGGMEPADFTAEIDIKTEENVGREAHTNIQDFI